MKNQFNRLFKAIFCAVAIIGIFFLFSEYEAYRPKTPPFLGSIAEPFKDKGVHIRAKAYTKKESKMYLSRNLLSRGYQPVQLTIQNNTAHGYLLSNHGVDIPNASAKQVAFRVTSSAIPRSIAFKVAGLIFWPFLIPGVIDSILTFKSHMHLQHDFYAKSIKDRGEILLPFSTVHRIIFIPRDEFSPDFTLYLEDTESRFMRPFAVSVE